MAKKRRIKRKPEAYIDGRLLKPQSLMMSYGYYPERSEGSVKPPLFLTSTFAFKKARDGERSFKNLHSKRCPRKASELIYSRMNNPNLEFFEDRLCLWDDAQACAVFDSGMAAITTVFSEFISPHSSILFSNPLYGGTEEYIDLIKLKHQVQAFGFDHRSNQKQIEKIITQNKLENSLAMIYIETPANPTNVLIDIEMCSRIAKKFSKKGKKIILCVDNTFLGPLWQHPLQYGADLVIYSATKYIGGHSDVVAGAVLGDKEIMRKIKKTRTLLGNMADPWTSWILCRSLETLKLRMACATKNAGQITDFLNNHKRIEKVYYPGLYKSKNNRQAKIFKKQCLAPGAMISFDIKGGKKSAFKFLNKLKLIKLAVSLGGTESLIEHPASMTHSGMPKEILEKMGISDSMIRLSVGIEDPEDLIRDLSQALKY